MEEAKNEKKGISITQIAKKVIGKIIRIGIYIFLTVVGINAILYMLLSIPPIQNALVNYAVNQLKPIIKTEASIGEIRLSILDQVRLKDVYIEDQATDTLLYAAYLDVKLSPWLFVKYKEVAITSLTLDNFIVNINQQDSLSQYNFQFLIDAFASDSTVEKESSASSIIVKLQDINIKRGRLKYTVPGDSVSPGIFNASDIYLYDLYANIDAKSIAINELDVAINNLSVKEKSGLKINSLSGHVYSNQSLLYAENLTLKLPNSHLVVDKVNYDLDTDKFEVSTHDAEIEAADLVAFLPQLKFLRHKLTLQAEIEGTLPSVDLKKLIVNYGNDATLDAKGYISNYEKFTDADVLIAINKLNINPRAINDFAQLGDSTFRVPAMVYNLGTINLKASLVGLPSNFDLAANLRVRQGAILLAADGAIDKNYNLNIKSKLETTNFEVGKLLPTENKLGKLTTHITIDAQRTEKQGLSAKVRGVVDKLEINDGALEKLYFVASYDAKEMGAKIYRDSKYGTIFAAASMTQTKVPDISVELVLDEFEIGRFFANEKWIEPRLCLNLKGELKGTDIDTMTGQIKLDSIHFHGDNFTFEPGLISLTMSKGEDALKDITLTSSLATANIHGEYKFTTLYDEFSNIMHKCMPSIFENAPNIKNNYNDFTYQFVINNNEHYSKIFEIPIDIIDPITIKGYISAANEKLILDAAIPKLMYGNIGISNSGLNIANQDSTFNVVVHSSVLADVNNYNLGLQMDGGKDVLSSVLTMSSDNANLGATAKIEAIGNFNRNEENELVSSLQFIPTDIKFGELVFNLLPGKIENVASKTMIDNMGLNLNGKGFVALNGTIAQDPEEVLKVQFTQAQIGDLLKGVNIHDYQAVLDGEIMLSNVFGKYVELNIYDFMVRDITILSNTIGTLNVASNWGEQSRGLEFDALLQKDLRPIGNLKGQYTPRTDSLEINVNLDRFALNWIEPYTEGVLNKLEGSISMNLDVKGTLDNPKTQGFFGFNDTQWGVALTNVVYTLSDTIQVSPERIGFKDLKLRDEYGNTALVNANITHKDYKDIKMALDMNLNQLMVLNTMHQTDSLFYGKIFASGKVDVKSDKNKMDVVMQIKNEKNSKLNILLPQTSEASNYSSVVYINVPKDTTQVDADSIPSYTERPKTFPIMLKVALELNQHLDMGVVIDPITGDKMDMKGNGDINFTYDIAKDIMTTYGRFVLTEGNVNFNLQNIKKLDFKIRPASNLTFVGDPFKTTFDIIAYRRVRADLKALDYSFESESQSSRIQVDCELGIKGDMNKMDLSYDISLPNATDDQKRKVSSLINTDEERIKQFAYLIAAGAFYSSTGSSGANFGDGMWTSMASSTLSSGLNSALGNMLGDKWEIGTNLESTDGTMGSLDMSVNVSTKLLDDKLRLNTSLGYRTDNSTSTNNSFIGDFDAEYSLSSTLMLKAYNHTNDSFYRQAPTTQGVGVAYTKDASSLRNLFSSISGRRKKWRNQRRIRQQADSIAALRTQDSLYLLRQDTIIDTDSLRATSVSINEGNKEQNKWAVASINQSQLTNTPKRMPLRNEENE